MKEAVEVLIDQQAESSVMGVSTRKLSAPTSEPSLVVKIQDGENNQASMQLNGSAVTTTETSKRGRGRPKKIASVNTPPPSTGPCRGRGKGRGGRGTAQVTPKEEAKKRGRGRPPKSKDKIKESIKENSAGPTSPPPARKRKKSSNLITYNPKFKNGLWVQVCLHFFLFTFFC